jgi:RimJ/RimL family protein N-acetyltransferase
MDKSTIKGKKIFLRRIRLSDVNQNYLSWMNDPETTQFLECRFTKWTKKKLKNYLKEINKDRDCLFFAIVLNKSNKHIGNIKLGPINRHHLFGDIGILIGDKSSRGKGHGQEAIKLLVEFAFKKLRLHKVTAGIYANNIGSNKVFVKAGFKQAGVLAKHRRCNNNQLVDEIIMEKLNLEN